MGSTRRSLLIGSGCVLLAGCTDAVPGMGPEYEDKDEIPPFPEEALEGDGWEREPTDDGDELYIRYDGDIQEAGVFYLSNVAENTDKATDNMDRILRGVQREEFELADEAYWGDDGEVGMAVFRHSNAVGLVGALQRSGLQIIPDTRTAIDLAERWFEDW